MSRSTHTHKCSSTRNGTTFGGRLDSVVCTLGFHNRYTHLYRCLLSHPKTTYFVLFFDTGTFANDSIIRISCPTTLELEMNSMSRQIERELWIPQNVEGGGTHVRTFFWHVSGHGGRFGGERHSKHELSSHRGFCLSY